nr:hypothetical protein GCM10020093_063100 [Planobispora longispora]
MGPPVAMEIEDKFDVPADYEIPDLTGLPGCDDIVGPRSHQLVAIYFDTPDLRLAARGITLRRRRGGTDPGWHLKLPKTRGARQEITHPLTRSIKTVPPELADLVLAFTRGAPLVPVAELDTRRSVTLLRNGAGVTLVEVADDRVKGTVLGEEPHVERWREVEAELGTGDGKLLERVGKRLRKAGASPAGSSSKLARLLGAAREIPAVRVAKTGKGSAGEIIVGYLSSQVAALFSQDPGYGGPSRTPCTRCAWPAAGCAARSSPSGRSPRTPSPCRRSSSGWAGSSARHATWRSSATGSPTPSTPWTAS